MYFTQTIQGLRGLGDDIQYMKNRWDCITKNICNEAVLGNKNNQTLVFVNKIRDAIYKQYPEPVNSNLCVAPPQVADTFIAYEYFNIEVAKAEYYPYWLSQEIYAGYDVLNLILTISRTDELGILTLEMALMASKGDPVTSCYHGLKADPNGQYKIINFIPDKTNIRIPDNTGDMNPPPLPDDCPCDCYEVERSKTLYLSKTNPGNGTPVKMRRKRYVCDVTTPQTKKYDWDCDKQLKYLREQLKLFPGGIVEQTDFPRFIGVWGE